VTVEQPEPAADVLIEHEILAHETDGLDRIFRKLAGTPDRHPVTPQQITHRRSRADLGEQPVSFRTEHARPRWCSVAVAASLLKNQSSATAIYWLSPFVYRMLDRPWDIAAEAML
jgi:hypothetical protein